MTEKNKFIKGSIILICANAIAKLLGAIFKIPLAYILREDGMAVYNTAFSVYIMMLSLVTSGFPFALTKLLAEYTALGKEERIRPAIRCAAAILSLLGASASLFMYFFAAPLAYTMREPNAAGAIRAVSVSVFFVALGCVIKSSNEARANLLPTALSQVSEAALKLFAGFYLALEFSRISPWHAAEGAILGVSIGEIFATSLLFIMWKFTARSLPKSGECIKELRPLACVAIPMLICGCASGLLNMAEVSVIRGALSAVRFTEDAAYSFLLKYSSHTDVFDNLCSSLCFSQDGVRKLFGAYSGYAQTVFNLPVGIIATISAAATPMFASAIAAKTSAKLARCCERVLYIVMLLAVPCCAVCLFFPDRVLLVLFGTDFSASMLASLAPSMILLCASNLLIAVLHLSGKIIEPFAAIGISLLVKIFSTAVLIRIPALNIMGAGLSVCISSLVLFILISAVFRKNFGFCINIIKICLAPAAASCLMILAMHIVFARMPAHLSAVISFGITSCIGGAVYAIAAFMFLRGSENFIIIGKKSD